MDLVSVYVQKILTLEIVRVDLPEIYYTRYSTIFLSASTNTTVNIYPLLVDLWQVMSPTALELKGRWFDSSSRRSLQFPRLHAFDTQIAKR